MRGQQDHSRERTLRRTQTDAERHLWRHLRSRSLRGHKFRRQHRIGPYYADFVCLECRLVVELDGSQHLAFAAEDAHRTRVLAAMGYRVLRFWNDDVLLRTTQVLDVIVAALVLHSSPDRPSPCVATQRGPSLSPRPLRIAQGRSVGRAPMAHKRPPSPRKRGEG